jgi:hypothetical protein
MPKEKKGEGGMVQVQRGWDGVYFLEFCTLWVKGGMQGGGKGVPGGARVGSREEGRVISIIGDEE